MSTQRKPNRAVKAIALTHRAIESLQPKKSAYRIPDLKCSGLSLRVAPSGLRTWEVQFRIRGAGVVRRKSLGPFPAIGLEEARSRAIALVRAAKGGRDIIAEEREAREQAALRITIEKLINIYTRRATKKLRTAHEIELRLRRALAPINDRCAEDIRRRDIRDLLDAVADRGAPREAEKQRQSIGAMFRWGIAQDLVETDPTKGLSSYGTGELRNRVLDHKEIGTLWGWLETSGMLPAYVDVLHLQICIGARVGEIAGMQAEEFDLINWVWKLPGERSKNAKVRFTPIVGRARNIIEAKLKEVRVGALFTNDKGAPLKSNNVGSCIVSWRKQIPIPHFVSHDLRRTVATQLVELGMNYETVAAVLGHETGDRHTRILTRHYIRSDFIDRKRVALEAWDSALDKILNGNVARTNVVSIGGRRLEDVL